MLRLVTLFAVGLIFFSGCGGEPAAPPAPDVTPSTTDNPLTAPPSDQDSANDGKVVLQEGDAGLLTADSPQEAMRRDSAAPKPPSEEGKPAEPSPIPEPTPAPDKPTAKPNALSGSDEAPGKVDPLAMYAGEDAVAAVVLSPSSFLKNPVVKQIWGDFLALEGGGLSENLDQMEQETGIRPEDVKKVMVIATEADLESLPMLIPAMNGRGGMPMVISQPLVVLEMSSPVAAESLFNSAPGEEETVFGDRAGKNINGGGQGQSAIVRNGETHLFIGRSQQIEDALNREAASPLASDIDFSESTQTSLVVDIEKLKPTLGQLSKQAPNPAMMLVMGYVQQLTSLKLNASVDQPNLLSASIGTINEDSANALQQMLAGLVQQGSQSFAMSSQEVAENDPGRALLPMVQSLIDGTQVTAKQSTIQLAVPRPADFENLPVLLKPAMEQARAAAKQQQQKNNLKQIALGFHNYHDVYKHFPAMDSSGGAEADRRGEGLSWRVHLLPFLDQAPLYEQFHLDEPWDSEHNLTLVNQIPELFANGEEEGTTTLHVITGEGAPFQPEANGPRIRDITDGTSNTILAVEAGQDTAEVWTKPGGLKINKEDPMKTLGEISTGFLTTLMDGSVRFVSETIDSGTLLNLFQHQDGNPIQ